MSCDHSHIPPMLPDTPCPGGPYHYESPTVSCQECAIKRADATNAWDFEKDMRRGYCPQPGCGVALWTLPEKEQPEWYRQRMSFFADKTLCLARRTSKHGNDVMCLLPKHDHPVEPGTIVAPPPLPLPPVTHPFQPFARLSVRYA